MNEADTRAKAAGRRDALRPLREGTLRFSCHPGVPCFNECCADLRLILTPYDILRIKRRLGISATDFLQKHTLPADGEHSLFPMLRLRMQDEGRRACPFVRADGCAIYEDRPGACRLYPLGRAASGSPGDAAGREAYFLVEEAHCLGFREQREWTVETWLDDQGARLYNEMNRPWMEVVTCQSPRLRELTEDKLRMFYMTSYNLDRFRDFVFQSRFLEAFPVPLEEIERIRSDEVALMKLGMRWLRFALFGENMSPTRGELLQHP